LSVLKVAVVGHTNTGKTSLLRTLTQDVSFGEVSDHPGTTRHVEGTALLVDGAPLIELYDTPGLEDSIGLLEHLDWRRSDRRTDWVEVIGDFLESAEAEGRFEQEAKALGQVLASDIVLYVIDARDRVLGKHKDELEILGRCARPVVPVLNFIVAPDAQTEAWRLHLTRANMHAVAEFDTVVLNETAEQRLFEKMLTLSDEHRPTLKTLIADRRRRRADLIRASANVMADMLVDVAAFALKLGAPDDRAAAMARLEQAVRDHEQRCVDDLLALFRFRPEDYEADVLPIEDGRWGVDLFNPASLKQFGVHAGGGAAAGGLAGLAVDAMVGGLSLGAAAAIGAAIGALWGSAESHGRWLADAVRGYTRLSVADNALRVLMIRELELVRALLRRGHASQDKIRLAVRAEEGRTDWAKRALPEVLDDARLHPDWSHLNKPVRAAVTSDKRREQARDALSAILEGDLAWTTAIDDKSLG
jgi:GTPase Era involved in 16S rRNA processing